MPRKSELTDDQLAHVWPVLYREYAASGNDLAETGRDAKFPAASLMHILRAIIYRLELKPTDYLLDVGCGNGLFDIVLCGLVERLFGVDIVPEQVNRAEENHRQYRNAGFQAAPSHELPVADGSFDKLLCCGVIQLVPPQFRAVTFREFWRVLRPGGIAYIHGIPEEKKYRPIIEKKLADVRSQDIDPLYEAMFTQCYLADPRGLVRDMIEIGFDAKIVSLPAGDTQAAFGFGLVLTKPK